MLESYENHVENTKDSIKNIVENIIEANKLFIKSIQNNCENEEFNKAKQVLKNITPKINDIDNELIKILALYSPEAKDLREIIAYFKINNELLRTTANTKNLIIDFINECKKVEVNIIDNYILPLQTSAIQAFEYIDLMMGIEDINILKDSFHKILVEQHKTDDLYSLLEKKVFENLQDKSDFEKIYKMLRACRRSKKIVDRAVSISHFLVYIKEGGILEVV